jgi:hypothetical protein
MIADEEEFERDLKDLGRFGADDEFTVALYNDAKTYLLREDFDLEAVRDFVEVGHVRRGAGVVMQSPVGARVI